MKVNDFIHQRIQENKNLFTQKELRIIKENPELTKKLYLLGLLNASK